MLTNTNVYKRNLIAKVLPKSLYSQLLLCFSFWLYGKQKLWHSAKMLCFMKENNTCWKGLVNYPLNCVYGLPGTFKCSWWSFSNCSKAHANSQTLWKTENKHLVTRYSLSNTRLRLLRSALMIRIEFKQEMKICIPFIVIKCPLKAVCEILVMQTTAFNLVRAEDAF